MQVTDALIDKLSRLSMLSFSEAEREEVRSDLQKMIGFVDKLRELDTTGVQPLLHLGGAVNVLRDDVVQGMADREAVLQLAPHQDGRFFLVPRVIKKEGE